MYLHQVKREKWKLVSFDASVLSSGVYFNHLQADNFLETWNMTLVK